MFGNFALIEMLTYLKISSDKYKKRYTVFSGVRSKFDFKVPPYWKFALVIAWAWTELGKSGFFTEEGYFLNLV